MYNCICHPMHIDMIPCLATLLKTSQSVVEQPFIVFSIRRGNYKWQFWKYLTKSGIKCTWTTVPPRQRVNAQPIQVRALRRQKYQLQMMRRFNKSKYSNSKYYNYYNVCIHAMFLKPTSTNNPPIYITQTLIVKFCKYLIENYKQQTSQNIQCIV